MTKLVFWVFILLVACQMGKKSPSPTLAVETYQYDSLTAAKWQADEYGMKSYVLVFLKRGPNRPSDSLTRAILQEAHMKNISKLASEGKLLLAGPMMTSEDIRGIYLFDVRTLEEAKALTETDPAIQTGSLIMEMHTWYGSAALMELPNLHKKGAKIEI
jgi:uncharacterized protein